MSSGEGNEPFDYGQHTSAGWAGKRFETQVCFKGDATKDKPSCLTVCDAVIAAAAADWTKRPPGPSSYHIDILTKVPRDTIRNVLFCHPNVAKEVFRLLIKGLNSMTPEEKAKCSAPHRDLQSVDVDDRREMATKVVQWFCDPKAGKIKLFKNRELSIKNTADWKSKVESANEIKEEMERKARVALGFKLSRWNREMLQKHFELKKAEQLRREGKRGNEVYSPIAVSGIGTATLNVAIKDPMAGLKGHRLIQYTAPTGMVWIAADASIGVAYYAGKIVICLLPWDSEKPIPAASSVQLGKDCLPEIAFAVVSNGFVLYSYDGAICRTPVGPKYEGGPSLSRSVMEFPGTSTIVMLHGGHSAFCVNSQFGVVWPQIKLPGVRRVSVVSWNPEAPIVGDAKQGRTMGRYNRPSSLKSGPFKIYDKLPPGTVAGTPIPAVSCGDTMVACQLGSTVYLVFVPFIGVGHVSSEWLVEKWGDVDGTLLSACVTPEDTVRLATTTAVYDGVGLKENIQECTTAAWLGYNELLCDDSVIEIAVPDDEQNGQKSKKARVI